MRLVSKPRGSTVGDVRALLAKALDDARAIDEPVLAYFIEMAISEALTVARGGDVRPETVDAKPKLVIAE